MMRSRQAHETRPTGDSHGGLGLSRAGSGSSRSRSPSSGRSPRRGNAQKNRSSSARRIDQVA